MAVEAGVLQSGKRFIGLSEEQPVTGVRSCSQLPFVWMEAVSAGATGVKVGASVGLHLIRGYEFWGQLGNVL